MIRRHLAQLPQRGDRDFRWRGGEVSRLEGLSDAAFGVALALLIVSSTTPSTYGELERSLRELPAFAICFVSLILPWYGHYKFFRRFGLQDLWTVTLNTALLLVVLFYVYPLKFLFTFLIDLWFGLASREELRARMAGGESLMVVYGLGFVAVFGILALLNLHGYRKRRELELDAMEAYLTAAEIQALLLNVAVGAASVAMSLAGLSMAWCGMVYMLLGPLHFARGWYAGARVERLRKARGAAELPADAGRVDVSVP